MEKRLYYLIIFSIPLNLGKHFIFKWSYVNGILIDYLIPTIYLQDLLILVLLGVWFVRILLGKSKQPSPSSGRLLLILLTRPLGASLVFFTFSILLSILVALNVYVGLYAFIRLLLYILFSLYIAANVSIKENLQCLIKTISLSVFCLSLLGLGQWINQGSIFNNYLFFGEQPYNVRTFGITRKFIFNQKLIPPYGTFRHPNVFGGYLCVTLLWLISYLVLKQGNHRFLSFETKARPSVEKNFRKQPKYLDQISSLLGFQSRPQPNSIYKKIVFIELLQTYWLHLVILIGVLVMLLTFSAPAIGAFSFGLLILLLYRFNIFTYISTTLVYALLILIIVTSLLVPFSYKLGGSFSTNNSFIRRADLLVIAVNAIKTHCLYGIGLNNSTLFMGNYAWSHFSDIFIQPVHNIFLLIFMESGVFSVTFFCLFIFFIIRNLINQFNYNLRHLLVKSQASISKSTFVLGNPCVVHFSLLLLITITQFFILGSFDHYLFTSNHGLLLFWTVIGYAIRYYAIDINLV